MGPPGGKKTPNYPPTQNVHSSHQQFRHPEQSQQHNQAASHNIPQPRTVFPQQNNSSAAVEHDELPLQDQHDLDNVDGVSVRVRPSRVAVNVSYEQAEAEITESTPNLLTSFIVNRMENDGYHVPHALQQRRVESRVAQTLQRIGDDLHNNSDLNSLISEMRVTPQAAYKTFAAVAMEIFQDGNINWGRIVTLFYFAYKLALQSLKSIDLIDLIISWVTKFVAEKLARWIHERGGWQSMEEYFGSTSGQMVGVFIAGLIVASLFNWWWRR